MVKKRGKNEGTIRKRKDGRWEARVTVGITPDGKQKRRSLYGDTREEAAAKMTALLNDLNRGVYIEPTDLTVGQWLDFYMQNYKKPFVKPTSYISYQGQAAHIHALLGCCKLKDLRPGTIQQFVGRLQMKGFASSTIQGIFKLLHAALEQAAADEIILKNAAHRIKLPTGKKKEIKVMSPTEQDAFIEVAKTSRLGGMFILDLCTGLRLGELLALRWSDIDFERKTLSVRGTLHRLKDEVSGKWYLTIGTPKTKSSYREIPLQPAAIRVLSDIRKQQALDMARAGSAYEKNDLVFCGRLGRLQDEKTARDAFLSICGKAGLQGLHIHCLRHTFATRGLENEIALRVMQDLLGHASYKETADTYTHVLADIKENEMRKLEGVVNY